MQELVEVRAPYEFPLSDDRVAQEPPEARGGSRSDARLLVMDRDRDVVAHCGFTQFGEFLHDQDVLVLNNARVVPSLLYGKDVDGCEVVVNIFSPMDDGTWHCLVVPKTYESGATFTFGAGNITGTLVREQGQHLWRIAFQPPELDTLTSVAEYNYPYYLKQAPVDPECFQTVYGSRPGATGLCSAGRQFTVEILDGLKERGVAVVELTLDITVRWHYEPFQQWYQDRVRVMDGIPISEECPENQSVSSEVNFNPPGPERYEVSLEVSDKINDRRRKGGRIVVCGTSVLRTLETVADSTGQIYPGRGWTSLVICPGHQFRACDAFLTKFHRPRSRELLLTSSLVGRERLLEVYRDEVLPRDYEFHEYGDSMLIM